MNKKNIFSKRSSKKLDDLFIIIVSDLLIKGGQTKHVGYIRQTLITILIITVVNNNNT